MSEPVVALPTSEVQPRTFPKARGIVQEVALAHVAAIPLLIDERFRPKLGQLEPIWMLSIYFALPLGVLLLLEPRWRPRVIGLVAVTVATFPVIYRSWAHLPKGYLEQSPEILVVPALLSLAIAIPGAVLELDLDRYGLGLGDWRWWGPRVGALCAAIVPFVLICAYVFPALLEYYPSKLARDSTRAFATLNAGRGLYFIAWEWYFRGLLLFGLAQRLGPSAATIVQSYPFFLLHKSKPVVEMASSFTGSILLCWFCWRAGSFWPAFILHWVMNLTMECVGLLG